MAKQKEHDDWFCQDVKEFAAAVTAVCGGNTSHSVENDATGCKQVVCSSNADTWEFEHRIGPDVEHWVISGNQGQRGGFIRTEFHDCADALDALHTMRDHYEEMAEAGRAAEAA